MFNIPLNEAYTTKHFVNNMLIYITIIQNYSLHLDDAYIHYNYTELFTTAV